MSRAVRVGCLTIGGGAPLAVIAGPCVIESREAALRHAERLQALAARAGVGLVYKSSFDKANRTALGSFRGVGMDDGLAILAEVRRETGLPVLTDVHEKDQIAAVAEVVDVLQTPALRAITVSSVLLLTNATTGIPPGVMAIARSVKPAPLAATVSVTQAPATLRA